MKKFIEEEIDFLEQLNSKFNCDIPNSLAIELESRIHHLYNILKKC